MRSRKTPKPADAVIIALSSNCKGYSVSEPHDGVPTYYLISDAGINVEQHKERVRIVNEAAHAAKEEGISLVLTYTCVLDLDRMALIGGWIAALKTQKICKKIVVCAVPVILDVTLPSRAVVAASCLRKMELPPYHSDIAESLWLRLHVQHDPYTLYWVQQQTPKKKVS